ncbi:MAG: ImmA/IrrE family metallo-endopeptidase [Lachnospiraceae bacterium]|nr:ImmA/IrrE family metallo-endopeptidase [Lachnospiraceae bacterium]
MNIERLRKIIAYSEKNYGEINSKVKGFCAFTGIEYDNDLLNILQIVRSSFQKKRFLVLELPFADDEIGALCYKGDGLGYVVINTSLPRVNVNFAIAHEIYHVFCQENEFVSKVEFSNDNYFEHEEEYAANLFAGMLLMPENSFRRMYITFKEESKGNEIDTIIRLVSYYQVPYMAVLIRCLELNLLEGKLGIESLLSVDRTQIRQRLSDLWLDESIMDASNKDDFSRIERFVDRIGREYIENEYINERTLEKVLLNMRELYKKIKGE